MNTNALSTSASAQGRKTTEIKALAPFLAITFSMTWGIAAVLILFTDQIAAIFGEISLSNLLVFLAIYAPGIAGVFLVWWYYDLKGLVSFFRQLMLWRAPLVWWLFLTLGIPAVVFAGALEKGTAGTAFPFSP